MVATFRDRLHAAAAMSSEFAVEQQRLGQEKFDVARDHRELQVRRVAELEREIPRFFRELTQDEPLRAHIRYRGPLPYSDLRDSHFYELLWQEGPHRRALQLVLNAAARDPADLRRVPLEYGFLQDGEYVVPLTTIDPVVADQDWMERASLALINPEPWTNGTLERVLR